MRLALDLDRVLELRQNENRVTAMDLGRHQVSANEQNSNGKCHWIWIPKPSWNFHLGLTVVHLDDTG